MKKIFLAALVMAILPLVAWAEGGVVIEAKGDVKIVAPSGGFKEAKVGSEFPHGSKVVTGKGASATVFLKSGLVKKLGAGETFVSSGAGAQQGSTTLFQGMVAAAKDTGARDKGPTVHGMVKERINLKGTESAETNEKALKNDLNKVRGLKITSPESKGLLEAEVYYKYGRYSNVVSTLGSFCKPGACGNEAARNLMRDSYTKLGDTKNAGSY